MANFANQQLTDLGWDAISEQNIGRRLLFTRVMAGDGELPPDVDPDDLSGMTELENYVMDMNIGGMTADGHGRATIYASILSRDVQVGFFLREIGIMAVLDEGEPTEEPPILYSICNAGDQTTYIPAADETSKVILGVEVHIIVGKATNIDVTVTAGTIQAINLGDPQFPAVLSAQTGLIQEFRRLRSPNNSIELTQGVEYVDIESAIVAPGPGEPGGPDSPDPQPPEGLLLGLIPIGTILPYGGAAAPVGYFMCNGAAVSRVNNARLFSIISTIYGLGDGVTTFNLPNLQGRAPIGTGLAPGAVTDRVLGQGGGVEDVQLAIAHMPNHDHGGTLPGHGHGLTDLTHGHGNDPHAHGYTHPFIQTPGVIAGGAFGWFTNVTPGVATGISQIGIHGSGANVSVQASGAVGFNTGASGGNVQHTNMQPFIVVNYIIKF
jgi:microcystin-dependent protein